MPTPMTETLATSFAASTVLQPITCPASSMTALARSELGLRHGEGDVGEAPSSEMFWTIMSTLMLASASGTKIGGGDARPVLDVAQRDLRLVLRIGDAGDDLLFHDLFLVADEGAGIGIGGIVEGRADKGPHLVHHGQLDRADLQHLGAERGHFEHFLEGDAVEPPRLRHDARVGGVDAVDVGVDVAAVGPDRAGDRHGAGVRAAAAERRDAAGRRLDALEAGDHGDLAARRSRRRDWLAAISEMRAAPCASSVWIGTCQPCQERAWMPMPVSTMASRPEVTCSPEATTASYSRGSWSGAASLTQPTSSLVLPDMAETTTATS